jgi:hypothetical protein
MQYAMFLVTRDIRGLEVAALGERLYETLTRETETSPAMIVCESISRTGTRCTGCSPELYRSIAERVWDPVDLLRESAAGPG